MSPFLSRLLLVYKNASEETAGEGKHPSRPASRAVESRNFIDAELASEIRLAWPSYSILSESSVFRKCGDDGPYEANQHHYSYALGGIQKVARDQSFSFSLSQTKKIWMRRILLISRLFFIAAIGSKCGLRIVRHRILVSIHCLWEFGNIDKDYTVRIRGLEVFPQLPDLW